MGFPGRTSYEELGGSRENRFPLTNAKQQVGFDWTNEIGWQTAGMNKVSCIVSLVVAANGDRTSGGEAWNQEDDPTLRVSITKTGTGVYEIEAQETEYPDWTGTNQPVIFNGAIITALSATSVRPPTYTRDSATKITVFTWNASGVAANLPFTIDIK